MKILLIGILVLAVLIVGVVFYVQKNPDQKPQTTLEKSLLNQPTMAELKLLAGERVDNQAVIGRSENRHNADYWLFSFRNC